MVRKERLELSHLGRQNLNLVRLPISPLPHHNGVRNGARTHDNRNHNPGLYQLSYSHHIVLSFVDGVPYRIRTCDPLLRRQLLYPAEPRAHNSEQFCVHPSINVHIVIFLHLFVKPFFHFFNDMVINYPQLIILKLQMIIF